MRVTIYGPNLPRELSRLGTLVVHKEGCADTKRGPYRRLSIDSQGWTIEATTIADVVEDIYPASNFVYDPKNADEYSPYRSDVHVFPCVELPEQKEEKVMGEWMPTEGGNKGVVTIKPMFEFKVGNFVSEVLVTDTRTYEVVAKTAKTIKVRTTSQGEVIKSARCDGNPWPLTWTEAVSDATGKVFALRLRKDGTYRMSQSANPLRPATMVDGKPTTYTDYRF